jgi:hypothetical protein
MFLSSRQSEALVLKLLARGGALVVCGSALALTASVLPAQAASTGWRADATVAVKGESVILSGIDALTAKDAWAAGVAATHSGTKLTGLIEHWAGRSWRRVKLPANVAKTWTLPANLFDVVAASSASNVWAFGEIPNTAKGYDTYLHFNGKTWTTGKLPGAVVDASQLVYITSSEAFGKSDVWVFGGKLKVTSTQQSFVPYAAEFNGHRWVTRSVPGSGEITAFSAVSARDIWAVTGVSGPTALGGSATATSSVLRWNGARWAAAPGPKKLPAHANLTGIVAQAGNRVWIAGAAESGGKTTAQFVDRLSGSSWAAKPTDLQRSAASSSCQPASIVPDGHRGLWVLGGCMEAGRSQLWHFTAGTWSAPTSPMFGGSKAELLQLAAVPGTGSVWAAGVVQRGESTDGLVGLDGPAPK